MSNVQILIDQRVTEEYLCLDQLGTFTISLNCILMTKMDGHGQITMTLNVQEELVSHI